MPLLVVLIGHCCRDVIGCQNVKVVVIGDWLLFFIRLLFVWRLHLRSCMSHL